MDEISFNCVVTDSYKNIYEKYFLPSFENSQVILNSFYNDSFSSLNWGDEKFKKAIYFKIEKVIETLEKYQIVIWSDVDMFFCASPETISKEIKNYLEKFDLVVSPERSSGRSINSGFFACKSSEKTLNFFNKLLRQIKKNKITEQKEMQNLLHARFNGIYWKILPRYYWNITVGFPLPSNLRIVHANWINNRAGLGVIKGKTYTEKKDFALNYLKNLKKTSLHNIKFL